METEIAELDARKAAVEAALALSHQRTHALERESTDNLGASRSPSPPCESLRRSPQPSRRSHSPQSEVAALMQLFQQQQQQAADREQRREERRDEQRREDRREAAEREERL